MKKEYSPSEQSSEVMSKLVRLRRISLYVANKCYFLIPTS